jgi:hypothetical protein
VYLESRQSWEKYLTRLQNLAGDRPLLLAEVGVDSRRNGEERQAEKLEWLIRGSFVQAPNDVVALDAATGRAFWLYSHVLSPDARPCCGRVNRGLAILGDTLFMGTIDAHLIALDAKSGRPLWDKNSGAGQIGLCDYARPSGREGQSDRGRGRRRVRRSRIHLRLRRALRPRNLALSHHRRTRRSREWVLGGRLVAARRRCRMGDGLL